MIDINGTEIKVGDYFVGSRKSGNCHELRFGYIVAVKPAIKTRMWLQCIGTLSKPGSILVVPAQMVPGYQMKWLLEDRQKDLP